MEMLYMTDMLSSHSFRLPSSYEAYSWDRQEKISQPKKPVVPENKTKGKCKLCQESHRRSLRKYIRSKSIDHPHQNIKEEEEEEEEDEEENKQDKDKTAQKETNIVENSNMKNK